jgi:hypothetical protein
VQQSPNVDLKVVMMSTSNVDVFHHTLVMCNISRQFEVMTMVRVVNRGCTMKLSLIGIKLSSLRIGGGILLSYIKYRYSRVFILKPRSLSTERVKIFEDKDLYYSKCLRIESLVTSPKAGTYCTLLLYLAAKSSSIRSYSTKK